jgi:AraC-like DNA-binding protein
MEIQITMQNNQSDQEQIARRNSLLLPDGSYLFQDNLEVIGTITATVITCTAWLLELYELQAGDLFFLCGDERVYPAAKSFGVLYPPFTISQPCFDYAKAHCFGFVATTGMPSEFTKIPVIFETAFFGPPSGIAQVTDILRLSTRRRSVEINPKSSVLSIKAKRLIDANHLFHPSIARIAARLGVTPEHLSRQFKRDFKMTPSAYLRQLRVADAPLKLARGEEIVDVAFDVGYNDLSRFYKQFRKTTRTSPGICKELMRPIRVSPFKNK